MTRVRKDFVLKSVGSKCVPHLAVTKIFEIVGPLVNLCNPSAYRRPTLGEVGT
jgi:hypothetical protein